MMGPTKLSVMRDEVRKAFQMTDAELAAWFDRQVKESKRKPKAIATEVNTTLQLLRDALVKEVQGSKPKKRRRPPKIAGTKH